MIRSLFATTAMKVSGALIAALLIACGLLWIGWTNADKNTAAAEQRYAHSEAQHAVTLQSLETLKNRLQALVDDGELRKERLSDALMQAREDGEELQREADAIRAAGGGDGCLTPEGVMTARGL